MRRLFHLVVCFLIDVSSPEELACFVCMSDGISNETLKLMSATVNVPKHARTAFCSRPFDRELAVNHGVQIETCDTACVKVIAQNIYSSIVLRGCLSTLFRTDSEGLPMPEINSVGSHNDNLDVSTVDRCAREIQTDEMIGEILTESCVCLQSLCNVGVETGAVCWHLLAILAFFYVLLY